MQFLERRKIIDSNYLRDPRLAVWLEGGSHRRVIINDYVAMEMYKTNPMVTVPKSIEILSRFPSQVIVLKSTRVIACLRGRPSGLQRRMIDSESTSGFPKFCRDVQRATSGDRGAESTMLTYGKEASTHLDRMRSDLSGFVDTLVEIGSNFTRNQLDELRVGKRYSSETIKKLIDISLMLSGELFSRHPGRPKWPTYNELLNTLIFRFALCSCILFATWVEAGRQKTIRPDKVLTDVVDLNHAACATFFHGLLTNDKKVLAIYYQAHFIVRQLGGVIQ